MPTSFGNGTSVTSKALNTAFTTTDADIALKANIASPTLTGVPSAPTATANTSTTQLATTAFVTTADNLKANLASPTFTGTPTLPTGTIATTQTAGNNTTAVATTAFVASAVPLAWTSYTPTLTQGVGVGKTVDYAKYVQIQKTVFLQIMLTCTGGGLGGTISVSFPSGLTPVYTHAQRVIGTFFIHDSGTALYSGLAMGSSPITGYGYGSSNNMGANTPTMTLATNDQISIAVEYEVA